MVARLKKKNLIEDEKEIVSFNPKKLINHFYEKVDVSTAAIVIFISIFIETLVLFLLKSPNVLSYFTIRLIITFVFSWFILGIIIYLILYFVKGKNNLKGGELKNILSSLAAFRIVSIIAILVVFAIVLIFMPKVIPFMSMAIQNPDYIYNSGMLPNLGGGAVVGLILLFIFSIALLVYYILMFYHFVKKMFNFEVLGNIVMTIILFVIMYFFSSIL
ncbi:hypothetical protein GW835_00570 [archaeon]|nr:hypothetical protein [archaeon]NCP79049.1 hypothetical protein [archaeon]NCP97568.1 hypothetical protein [archaeon]NCQ06816.1 hypothetical protein [archaeon]NCQ50612.1 hypothetical protein [archaeon]